jgi:hypothetical protein
MLARLPIAFERNLGQGPSQYRYLAHGDGYAIGLGRGDVMLGVSHGGSGGDAVAISTPGGALGTPRPSDLLRGHVSYLRANGRGNTLSGIHTYGHVNYRDVWPGIDLSFHGHGGVLEYDFDVAAGADPRRIALRFAGARSVRSDGNGGAIVTVGGATQGGTTIAIPAPRSFQDGSTVPSRLVVHGDEVRVWLGPHRSDLPLTIDPDLVFSTYLGGSNADNAGGIALDPSGDIYVTGDTVSTNYPVTAGTYETTHGAVTYSGYVTELVPSGTSVMYSTYFGQASNIQPTGIAVDGHGNAYVGGSVSNSAMPTTTGAPQGTFGGGLSDGFVIKLSAGGTSLDYATFLGGSGTDAVDGIALDSQGDAYVTGYTASTNFPHTTGVLQPASAGGDDGFVTKVNPTGTAFSYSTYLGSNGNGDGGRGIAVDSSGSAFVDGVTNGSNFPTTSGAYEATNPSDAADEFVVKLNAGATALDYGTYLGHGGIVGLGGIAIDSAGNAYVADSATDPTYPTTSGAFRTSSAGALEPFVTKLNPAGTGLVYSTFLGGASTDFAFGIAVDAYGDAWVTGKTGSSNFPVTAGAAGQTLKGVTGAFVSKLSPSGGVLDYSTYLSGTGTDAGTAIALDANGDAYVTGTTSSTNFPMASALYGTYRGGTSDAFVAELKAPPPPPPTCTGATSATTAGKADPLTLTCSAGGDPLTLSIVSGPAHGTLGSVAGNTVTYTANSSYSGPDSFTFRATDTVSSESSAPATYSLTVAPSGNGGGGGGSKGGTAVTLKLVVCNRAHKPRKCFVRHGTAAAGQTFPNGRAKASLRRRKTTYATGSARIVKGIPTLNLIARGKLRRGRYQLKLVYHGKRRTLRTTIGVK